MDISKILLYMLACLPAVILWGFIYYKKNPSKLSVLQILGTFLLGIASLLPILGYLQFSLKWKNSLLANRMVGELTKNPVFEGFFQFAITMLFLAFFVFVMVAVMSFALSFFRKEELKNTFRGYLEETTNFEIAAFVIGIVILIETIVRLVSGHDVVGSLLGVLLIMAVLEEYVKHLLVRIFNDHHLESVDQAISFSIYIGLGFAFAENVYYLSLLSDFSLPVLIGRSLFSTFGHLLFSAIFGYYYGVAHFSHPIAVDIESEHHKLFELPQWLYKYIPVKGENIFHTKKIIEGLLFAMGVHAIFNLFMALEWHLFTPLLLIGGYFMLDKILKDKENKKKFGLIGTDVMPPGEYEKLVTKINAIKWAQRIRAEREEEQKRVEELEKYCRFDKKLGRFTVRFLDYVFDELDKTVARKK